MVNILNFVVVCHLYTRFVIRRGRSSPSLGRHRAWWSSPLRPPIICIRTPTPKWHLLLLSWRASLVAPAITSLGISATTTIILKFSAVLRLFTIDYVLSLGFTNSRCDTSLFIYKQGTDMAYILVYVDDIILTASSHALRRSIMASLSSEFAMKDLGPLNHFLGIAVTRHKGGLFLSQRKYAEKIVERAGMASCKPSATPVDTKSKISATSG